MKMFNWSLEKRVKALERESRQNKCSHGSLKFQTFSNIVHFNWESPVQHYIAKCRKCGKITKTFKDRKAYEKAKFDYAQQEYEMYCAPQGEPDTGKKDGTDKP